ncbi:putative deoxyhypusine synthase [Symmachiella dynata]|uniref:deoxyhypusine synthase family protein n=1 Tax=Symmachiella dynata TaxID=2527995 RepID=UPI00118B5D99|nr:deoxyhypusine synthase family protein [Symmachiella dynata]QDT46348.1 putative deoxyhypusine synthase [Symmachiella dynata]
MTIRKLHDGREDGLSPLESLDLGKVDSFAGLLQAMSQTAFGGRNLGEAYGVLGEMFDDADCSVVLTLSGAMTVAKQGLIICEMIDRGLVQAVVATGALIAHGLTESIGLAHYRYHPSDSDDDLYEAGYNRIYDTLEMESNLNDVEKLVRSVLKSQSPPDGVWSSARLCRAVGSRLAEMNQGRGILRSAFEQEIPVFIPAFTDSEIGLDVATWAMAEWIAGQSKAATALDSAEVLSAVPSFNPFLDLQEYARLAGGAERLGILTVGGGVPRNWAQQVAPYYEISNARLGTKWKQPQFQYGVRICPEPVHWGGLSGCTYSEGVSWGKFVSPNAGGRFAEVYADATVALPLLMKAILEDRDSQE